MNPYRIAIKFFLAAPIDLEKLIPIWHRWIQEQGISGHLLIDVARYEHVSDGPRLVLVGHEANISYDDTDGRPGLIYQRKRPMEGEFGERLSRVLAATIEACSKLESEAELGAKFKTDELELKILDKLEAPNEPGTLKQLEPVIQNVLEKVFGAKSKLEQHVDTVRPFEVRAKFGESASMMDLLDRSAGAIF
ncbi:MAG TPA: hypothetical protein VGG19_17280 [Tepidisphaeraceae bacterium]|jgi:hypothetical protein